MVLRCLVVVSCLLSVSVAINPAGAEPQCGLHYELPCQINEGEHEGTLVPFAHDRHYYAFTPPGDVGVIRVTAESDSVIATVLYGPDDNVRDLGYGTPEAMASAIAQPAGTWLIEIGIWEPQEEDLPSTDYTFTLEFEAYENIGFHAIDGGPARTVALEFESGERAHADLVYHSPGPADPVTETHAFVYSLLAQTDHQMEGGHGTSTTFFGHISHDVKTWGSPLGDNHLPLPEMSQPGQLTFYTFDSRGAEIARFVLGVSSSWQIGSIDLWTVWNGDTPPTIHLPEGDDATFLTLADFEGSGPGVLAGGFASVRDLKSGLEVPKGFAETHRSTIYATGDNYHLLPEPDIALVKPDGERVALGQFPRIFSGADATEGTWRMEIDALKDWERDKLRFYVVHFAIREYYDAWWQEFLDGL